MSTHTRLLSAQEQTDVRAILHSAPIAYLAVADTHPYVVPINFVFDAAEEWGRIFFHSGEGRKTKALAADPHVCLLVPTEAVFDRGPTPCSDGFAYRSVLIEGKAVPLEAEGQREKALRMIVAKYDPAATHQPLQTAELARTLVYAIDIRSVSYKQRRKRS